MTTTASLTTAPATSTPTSRKTNIALWTLQVLLALFFVIGSGAPKFFAVEAATDTFDKIGYGDWFMYFTGGLEVAGGIALLIPRLAGLAASALIGLLAGAEIFTWAYLDGENWLTPIIAAVFVGVVAYGRRDSRAALYRQAAGS